MTKAVTATTDWALAFERAQTARAREPAWLRSLRAAAMERFHAMGIPTVKQESWKYTNLETVARTKYRATPPSAPPRVTKDQLATFRFPSLNAHEIVFVNGIYAPELGTGSSPPTGARIENLEAAATTSGVESNLAQLATFEDQPLVALNTALWHHGAYVEIAPKARLKTPLHLIFLQAGGREPLAVHPRTLVRVRAGAEAQLLETYGGLGEGDVLANAVTEIHLESGAHLQHGILQRQTDATHHLHTVEVEQERDASYTSHNVSLGARLARTDINTRLTAPGGEARLNGVYVLGGLQHVDNHTVVDHVAPNCTSHEYYKGILDGKSRGVFYGKVYVRPDAQKTNATQTNKNLLLSDGALVDSTPALEINANDVKCAHGSTTGQLDASAVFYLQTRGIDAKTARSLLTYAFARDLIGAVPWAPVRARLDELLLERLPHGPAVKETLHALEPEN